MQAIIPRVWTSPKAALAKHAVRSAIAAVVCLYITRFLGLPQGFWSAITAVVVMQSNVGATLSASRNRLIGTAIGAFLGAIVVVLWGNSFPAFGIALAITIVICSLLGYPEASRLAGVAVAIVMLASRLSSPWLMALYRFVEVSLGIVVALAAMAFIWPLRAREDLRRGIRDVLSGLASLFQASMERYRGVLGALDPELGQRIENLLRHNEELLKQAAHEPEVSAADRQRLTLLESQSGTLFHMVDALELAARDAAPTTYGERFEPELAALVAGIVNGLRRLAAEAAVKPQPTMWTELAPMATALDEKAASLGKTGMGEALELEEILRLHSVLLSLKNLAAEIDLVRHKLASLPSSPHRLFGKSQPAA